MVDLFRVSESRLRLTVIGSLGQQVLPRSPCVDSIRVVGGPAPRRWFPLSALHVTELILGREVGCPRPPAVQTFDRNPLRLLLS